jgi:hypothetical protein
MKTKIATALSIVGVLGAGSAAALVNTQILDSTSESSASAAVLPPAATVDLPVPTTTIDDDRDTTSTTIASRPATTSISVAPPATSPPVTASPAAEYLTAFNVGDAGVVTVDVVNGRLILVDVEAAPGWTVASMEEDDGDVEVKFASATVRVEFEARFDGSTIRPSVSSEALPTGTPAPASPTTSVHQDDDDDDHEDDDDHDDDDDDRDDD